MSRCRALSGIIYLKNLAIANQPYLPLGNAQAEFAATEVEQTQPDYTSVAGGNACSFKEIESVGLTLTVYDFKADNLAKAILGTKTTLNTTAIVDEPINLFNKSALNPTNRIVNGLLATVLTVGATTYVKGTDWNLSGAGVVVIAGSALDTAINLNASVPPFLVAAFDYTPKGTDVVEALMQSSGTYAVKIIGFNKADNNKEEIWTIHRLLIGPTGNFTIISREFGSFTLNGSITADTTRPNGESQYLDIELVS